MKYVTFYSDDPAVTDNLEDFTNDTVIQKPKNMLAKIYDWMVRKPKAALGALLLGGLALGLGVGWLFTKMGRKKKY